MRIRAHVDDDAWSFVQSMRPRANPSQIVQEGLVRLLASRHTNRLGGAGDGVLNARRHIAEVSERAYCQGYETGLRISAEIRWALLDRLAADGWPDDALNSMLPAEAHHHIRTELYDAGLRDALLAVWRGVRLSVELGSRC